MRATPDRERVGSKIAGADLTQLLVLLLVATLLAGGVLVRLVGDDPPTATTALTGDGDDTAAQTDPDAPRYQGPPRQGQPAPDFTLPDFEGRPVSLSDWRGHPVLINFWASWCGPCELEMPDIQAAYEAHRDEGLVVLAVAVDDTVDNARRFFEKHDLTFQPLMDDGEVSRVYQLFGLPTSVFVGPEGKVVAVHTGILTPDKIEDYLGRME